jgi:RimJ/RimL family protein N-acetyltransferase/8-oxo-dGTP pyrophosphatase MutT (NUDIX family)
VSTGPQPTLRDGDVVLRPWTNDDVDVARLKHDDLIAQSFGFPGVIPTHDQQADAVTRWREQYADERRVVNFVVERAGEVAGSVEVRQVRDGAGELSWTLYAGHRGQGTARRAVRLLIAYCFSDLGLERVEAHVEPGNIASLRLASRSGMRREGIVRGHQARDGQRHDYVLLGRLATDAAPEDPKGFRALLNAALPTKRVIAQGLLRDPAGRVLMCELTYKPDWDLPGGVVEGGESPVDAVVREVGEELGVAVSARSLLAVDWLPPWAGWDDACLFVFDLGSVDAATTESMLLEPREIAAVHWCNEAEVAEHSRAPTAARITEAVHVAGSGDPGRSGAVFLHGGQPYPGFG